MPSEPKTKPTAASVADFLDAVEHPGRREDGKVIAALMSEITGGGLYLNRLDGVDMAVLRTLCEESVAHRRETHPA